MRIWHHGMEYIFLRVITVFTVFQLLTDFVCLYTYEFWLSLSKVVRSSVILLLPYLYHLSVFTIFWSLIYLTWYSVIAIMERTYTSGQLYYYNSDLIYIFSFQMFNQKSHFSSYFLITPLLSSNCSSIVDIRQMDTWQ
jgi:hypothetical protein